MNVGWELFNKLDGVEFKDKAWKTAELINMVEDAMEISLFLGISMQFHALIIAF